MAEGNDPGTTPPTPVNPYVGGGYEQNIDQQKGFLNDFIAQQGQGARALYERTGASAQDVLKSQLDAAGGNPTARTGLFQAYVDDAKAAEARNAQSVQRQAALGNIFMDQTKAAIPLYAKNVDATTEAMRLQFEERRRKEEQNYQMQRAQLAASGSGRALTGAELGKQKAEQDLAYYAVIDPKGENPGNPLNKIVPEKPETVANATANKTATYRLSPEAATKSLNMPSWASLTSKYPGMQEDADYLQQVINGMADKKDFTFEDLKAQIGAALTGSDRKTAMEGRTALFDVLMAANAGRWGVSDPNRWNFVPDSYAAQAQTQTLFGPGFNPGNYSAGVGR